MPTRPVNAFSVDDVRSRSSNEISEQPITWPLAAISVNSIHDVHQARLTDLVEGGPRFFCLPERALDRRDRFAQTLNSSHCGQNEPSVDLGRVGFCETSLAFSRGP